MSRASARRHTRAPPSGRKQTARRSASGDIVLPAQEDAASRVAQRERRQAEGFDAKVVQPDTPVPCGVITIPIFELREEDVLLRNDVRIDRVDLGHLERALLVLGAQALEHAAELESFFRCD